MTKTLSTCLRADKGILKQGLHFPMDVGLSSCTPNRAVRLLSSRQLLVDPGTGVIKRKSPGGNRNRLIGAFHAHAHKPEICLT